MFGLAFPDNSYPTLALILGLYSILHLSRNSGYGIALLSLPGTLCHEILHWIFGIFLNAKPVSVSIWPKRQGNTWVLGSVGFTNLTIWNSAFVAFAPLLMFPLGWALFVHAVVPAWNQGLYMVWLLGCYVCACCAFAGLPSTTDIKLGTLSALMYGVIGYLVWYLG